MATYHKPYKGKKGTPVKKATGRKIGTSSKTLPSLRAIENRKRAANEARMEAKKRTR